MEFQGQQAQPARQAPQGQMVQPALQDRMVQPAQRARPVWQAPKVRQVQQALAATPMFALQQRQRRYRWAMACGCCWYLLCSRWWLHCSCAGGPQSASAPGNLPVRKSLRLNLEGFFLWCGTAGSERWLWS